MKRILFCVNTTGFFVTHRLPIAEALHAKGWEVHLATPDVNLVDVPLPAFIKSHRLRMSRSGMNPIEELMTIAGLVRLFRRLKPDIVHNVTIKPVLYGGLAARLAGVYALVSAVSGLGHVFHNVSNAAVHAVVRMFYRVAFGHRNHCVVVQNPDDLRALQVARVIPPAARIELIRGSGVDLERFGYVPEPSDVPVVLMASRLLRDKGVLDYLEAARLVKPSVPCRFLLAGWADPGNPTALDIEDLTPFVESGTVEYLGRRHDMPALIATCNVYVLPSYYGEGVPKALIEAAAVGRAIVTTDTPGCREVVRHEENGLLVAPKQVKALANAILSLLRDRDRRTLMGQRGRARAELEFDVRAVVAKHLEIYEELLGWRSCPDEASRG